MAHAHHPSGGPERRLRVAVLTAAVALYWSSAAPAAEATPEQVDQGREVYAEFCATCHGQDMINPGGFAFDLRTFPKADFERFRNSVFNGKGQGMPAWRDQLSEDDLTLLWAYIAGRERN
jgi:mono/diheme cytochrome c family protein